MRSFKWILPLSTISVLLLGSAEVGLTEPQSTPSPPPTPVPFPVGAGVQLYSGQASNIITGNCNSSSTMPPGLCQAAPACNGGAGPNPDNIQASVTLCEVSAVVTVAPGPGLTAGSGTLTGSGIGTGFRPGVTYISLLYKNGNTATCSRFPAGVSPTLQNLLQADSDFASMFLGFWKVNADGTATLMVNKQATVLGLNNYASVSVREMQPPNVTCFDCGNDPAPQFNALRACGALTVVAATNCSLP